jgi:3-oxoacyl-[acyl-carrier-protein] synthase-3
LTHTAIPNLRVLGVAAAVPRNTSAESDLEAMWGAEEARKISASSGIVQRRIAPEGVRASDLCLAAAERLLAEMPAETRAEIDVLVFVSQSPDHQLPATACVLQDRLGLAKSCAAFDISLGCSGYIYGMWVASSLLNSGTARKALLLVGDTISKCLLPKDRATVPLFGDAGTATLLACGEGGTVAHFVLGTDGSGAKSLIVDTGEARVEPYLRMDGAAVFTFTLKEIPPMTAAVLEKSGWGLADLDAIVFHQANRFMLQHLAKRLGAPADRFVVDLERFGNTSGASIPLALVTACREPLTRSAQKVLLAGFGVGFSWGACATTLGPMTVPELVEV